MTIFICDPGATQERFVIDCAADEVASPLKLNWLEFHGQGVATGHQGERREPNHAHDDDADH